MKKLLFTLLILFNCYLSFCQKLSPIQLDRPDQTECPFITPKGYIQMENGFMVETLKNGLRNNFYPSTLTKYGVNENFELRLITTISKEEANGINKIGLSPITIGFKSKLLGEKGIIPQTSFIGHITTSRWGSKEYQTNFIAPNFRFVMQHTISKKVSLSYNLGAEWDGYNPQETYLYTFTSGISLTEKLGFYVELYGYLPNADYADHRCDGGFTYLLNNDFMLDVSSGFGLSNTELRNYLALGVSYRFKVKK